MPQCRSPQSRSSYWRSPWSSQEWSSSRCETSTRHRRHPRQPRQWLHRPLENPRWKRRPRLKGLGAVPRRWSPGSVCWGYGSLAAACRWPEHGDAAAARRSRTQCDVGCGVERRRRRTKKGASTCSCASRRSRQATGARVAFAPSCGGRPDPPRRPMRVRRVGSGCCALDWRRTGSGMTTCAALTWRSSSSWRWLQQRGWSPESSPSFRSN